MAPPEPGPLRPHSSGDWAPVPQRVQPNLDAPVQEKLPQIEPRLQPQHQQRNSQHPSPPRAQDRVPSPGTPQASDGPTGGGGGGSGSGSGSGSHSLHPIEAVRGERDLGVGGETTGVHDLSAVVDAVLDQNASVARPRVPTPAVPDPRKERQPGDGDAPAAIPSPNMSNSQPPPGPTRQPMAYPNPAAYPPAGIPPVSPYVYPPSIPHADPYRPSPTTLPSMRTLDHRQSQAPQPQHGIPLGAPHMAAPVAPAPAPIHMGYYGVHPHSPIYSLPDPNAMRFSLAPGLTHDPRIALSGGRHKKEIKRRTKTGCLTCRKRRIKCDEAHPTCNNCKKSKRECLGYDPIFKQQQAPAAIQPAPSASNQAPATSAVVTTAAPPAAPVPAVPSSAAHPYQAPYPSPLPSSLPTDSTPSTAPQSVKAEPTYDYTPAIDPALQGTEAPTGAASARGLRYQRASAVVADVAGHSAGDPTQLRGGILSPHSNLSALSQPPSRETMSAHTMSPAKKMKVDELVALGATAPLPLGTPPSAEVLDEATKLYYELYLPGLTHFFETRWYDFTTNRTTAANPQAMLHGNHSLMSIFASFIQTIAKIKGTDAADMWLSGHIEASVVLSLARLPLSIDLPPRHHYSDWAPADDDPWEARGRVQVFEALLSGETLPGSPVSPPPATNIHPLQRNELDFWHQLATYLSQAHASASPADASARERCLSAMRSLLDGRENRDVLYSIAVLREYTAHWDACWNEQSVPSHLEESDPRSKLAVATRFIRDESTSTGGTTNVVRRFAELAYRAFVQPGVNVNRSKRQD